MKRTVLAFVLAFGFVVSAFGQDFRFVENNGQITITGRRGRATDVVIPERINGMPVVAIGYRAFFINRGNHRLTSLTIPNSVTHIGNRAFQGNRLTSLAIPNGVTHIGYRAFQGNRLTSLTIPNGVIYIGYRAFYRNRLTSLTIPNSVTYIGNRAFYRNRLTSLTIPNGVTYIARRAFAQNQLTSITIPNSVTHIGNYAFYENRLTSLTIPNGVTYIARRAFAANQLTSVTIPNGVTYIGYRAFYRNQLTRVTIPNGVIYIGYRAFYGNRLTSVSVPNNTSVGNRAFGRATVTRSGYVQAGSVVLANDAIDAILTRAIDDVSRGLATASRIAILDVSSSVGERGMAEFVTGELELILWRRGFTIVNRADLDRIRSEQQLGLTGEVDDNTAAGIGRIAGASVILTGGIDGTGDLRRLRLRALSTETGQVIGVTAERI